MSVYVALLLYLASASGNERLLDDFSFADDAVAQKVWVAAEGTAPVSRARDGRGIVVRAPFAAKPELRRVVVDRAVRVDLAAVGEFLLEIAVDPPEAAGHLTLYFHSGDGWYGASAGIARQGWQTVRFPKSSFRSEDRPAGWRNVDRIRIACWRGRSQDASVRIRRLSARWSDVAMIAPEAGERDSDGERQAARKSAEEMAAMLAEIGVAADMIDDAAVAQGALAQRRVAVLAYRPRPPESVADRLAAFAESGGKVFVCYSLPEKLGRSLGFAPGQYWKPADRDSLAEIRFHELTNEGMPESVMQDSWNIRTAEPAGFGARVIADWRDRQGRSTGRSAVLLSDRGVYFSHIVLADDRENKKRMLAALLGKLDPSLWRQMSETALAQSRRIGHCEAFDEAAAFVKSQGKPEASRRWADAAAARSLAEKLHAEHRYRSAIDAAGRAQTAARDAYLRAQPSREREGRAWWNHSGLGAYPGDWERTIRELAKNGFNMILPNMLWAGRAHYASNVLPRSSTYQQYGDQIAACVAAAKEHGVEVHVWKVNHNLSGAPKEFVERLREEGRLQVSVSGDTQPWLCPSHPDNLQLEVESMLEVASKYDVDGLHFDYIRYPGRETCYCSGCRERFEAQLHRKAANWPRDCYSGPLKAAYNDWRCRQITRLVRTVSQEAKRVKPGIKISAAVFGSYPACRESVAQDWPEWIKAGYLDFVCPMDYTESDMAFRGLVANQMELTGGRIPVYPGIGATASRSTLTADRVAGQIHWARSLGAAGFTIFNLSEQTAREVLPGVALGATSTAASPSHRP